jgi:uncharacterized protein YjbJ (UPF0337 family)
MYGNKLRGSWDQVKGFSSELWGEIAGDDQVFFAGLRKRMIGRLESYCDISRDEAEQQIDQLLQ